MTDRVGLRAYSTVLGLALGICLGAAPLRAQTDTGVSIYKRTLKSAVWIVAHQERKTAYTGTGSLIDHARRLVITNAHVVGKAQDFKDILVFFPVYDAKGKLIADRSKYRELVSEGGGIRGKVVARDDRRDLALIELKTLPAGAQVLHLAREGASPGQRVHSIGNPGRSGALWLYTSGTVRSQAYHKTWRVKEGERIHEFDAQVIETQNPTNQGDSGGPLVNDQGELVAVTQGFATDAQLLSLFIDVSEVKALLASKKWLAKNASSSADSATEEKSSPATDKLANKPQESAEPDEKEAARKLNFAKILADDGKTTKARERLEEIVAKYPNTKSAAEAKLLLDKLKK